ncbi:MAG: hypothetical protein WCL50_15410, partial [Spirochaetota bacterium]
MTKEKRTPLREEIPLSERWNLASLFASEAEWESSFADFEKRLPEIDAARENFGTSPEAFLRAAALNADLGLLAERLGIYAGLRQAENEGDSGSQDRYSRFMSAATSAEGAWAWFVPAVQDLPADFVEACLVEARFKDFEVFIRKILRWKPHVLSAKEERLLALQSEAEQTAS